MEKLVDENQVSNCIIGAAIDVHRVLGPGLLESAYETALAYELKERGIHFERQVALPVTYKGQPLDVAYRIDLLVEKIVIVELKAVDRLENIHEAQLLTYLKLSNCHLGLLLNFNVVQLKNGIRRIVYQLPDLTPSK